MGPQVPKPSSGSDTTSTPARAHASRLPYVCGFSRAFAKVHCPPSTARRICTVSDGRWAILDDAYF